MIVARMVRDAASLRRRLDSFTNILSPCVVLAVGVTVGVVLRAAVVAGAEVLAAVMRNGAFLIAVMLNAAVLAVVMGSAVQDHG